MKSDYQFGMIKRRAKRPQRDKIENPMDRLVAIQMESPVVKEQNEVTDHLVDYYDFNFLCRYTEKAIEAGIKLP